MPTNLPPEYFEVEKRYRLAASTAEKIACLEELISTIPRHKGTEKLLGDYRRKLSRLRTDSKAHKGASVQASVFHVKREGTGQVVVIGPTNVGKSALVAALTNATPEVAETPYTTWRPTPGMLNVGKAQIQLVDTPALDREYLEPELIDLIRRADLALLVVDLETDPLQQLEDTQAILLENLIAPEDLRGRAPDERLLSYVPMLIVANKCDDEEMEEVCQVFCELLEEKWPVLSVSATTGRNLEQLKQAVFERLDVIRVYSKAPGKEPDLDVPFVLKRGTTVLDLAGKIHHDFRDKLKFARVWGSTAFDGQMVQRDYVLQDGDVIELHL
jgi:ribosome-interacting GTPase 1